MMFSYLVRADSFGASSLNSKPAYFFQTSQSASAFNSSTMLYVWWRDKKTKWSFEVNCAVLFSRFLKHLRDDFISPFIEPYMIQQNKVYFLLTFIEKKQANSVMCVRLDTSRVFTSGRQSWGSSIWSRSTTNSAST